MSTNARLLVVLERNGLKVAPFDYDVAQWFYRMDRTVRILRYKRKPREKKPVMEAGVFDSVGNYSWTCGYNTTTDTSKARFWVYSSGNTKADITYFDEGD